MDRAEAGIGVAGAVMGKGFPHPMGAKRVLIVEDEALIAFSLAEVVENLGYQVAGPVASGAAAVRSASAAPPVYALVDMNLSDGRTGEDVVTHLSARYGTRCVVVSANVTEGLGERLGCGIVRKPFTDADIERALAALDASALGAS